MIKQMKKDLKLHQRDIKRKQKRAEELGAMLKAKGAELAPTVEPLMVAAPDDFKVAVPGGFVVDDFEPKE